MGQVARMLSNAEVDATVSYRLVELYDCECDEEVPTPRTVGHLWLSAGISRVMLESAADVGGVRFRFELWDSQPSLDQTAWPLSEVIERADLKLEVARHAGATQPVALVGPRRVEVDLVDVDLAHQRRRPVRNKHPRLVEQHSHHRTRHLRAPPWRSTP